MKYYIEIFKGAKITSVHSKLKEFIEGKDIDILRFDLLNEKTPDLGKAMLSASKAMRKENLMPDSEDEEQQGNEWVIVIMYAKAEDYPKPVDMPMVTPIIPPFNY